MAYTPATKFPSTVNYYQYSRPGAENPRLASPISSTATTIVSTNALLDYTGAVITGSVRLGCKNSAGFTEAIWCPAGSSSDGITFTNVVRGVRPGGLDGTTGNTSFAVAHGQDDPLFVAITGVDFQLMASALQGNIASGGSNWIIGTESAGDIKVYLDDGQATPSWWGKVGGALVYSTDGVSSTPFGTGAGVTGGDGITITAGDVKVDLTDTTTFRTSRNGNEARGVVTAAADGLISRTFMPLEVKDGIPFFSVDLTGVSPTREIQTVGESAALTFTAATHADTGRKYTVTTAAVENQGGGRTIPFSTSLHNKSPSFFVPAVFAEATAQDAFIGFSNTPIGTSLENSVMTLDHFGFVFQDGTVYGSCADGATQSKTADLGITVTSVHDYFAKFDGATVTFYIDGVAKGTLTTNVPNGTLTDFATFVVADGTGAAKVMNVVKTGRIEIDKIYF